MSCENFRTANFQSIQTLKEERKVTNIFLIKKEGWEKTYKYFKSIKRYFNNDYEKSLSGAEKNLPSLKTSRYIFTQFLLVQPTSPSKNPISSKNCVSCLRRSPHILTCEQNQRYYKPRGFHEALVDFHGAPQGKQQSVAIIESTTRCTQKP